MAYSVSSNNQLFKVIKENNTYLMLPTVGGRKEIVDFDVIYTIPSSKVRYVMEFPYVNGIRVFFSYWDEEKEKWVLESFDLVSGHRMASNKFKRYVNGGLPILINPTTFCYVDENNYKTLLSVHGTELQPQRTTVGNGSLKITDVTFGNYVEDEKDLVEVVLHLGEEERLHTFMVTPTKRYVKFMFYGWVYSELTNKACDVLVDDECDFMSFDFFVDAIGDSRLAERIVEKRNIYRSNVDNQIRLIREKRKMD